MLFRAFTVTASLDMERAKRIVEYFSKHEPGMINHQTKQEFKDLCFAMRSLAGIDMFRATLNKLSTNIATELGVFEHISLAIDEVFVETMIIYSPVFIETIATLEQYSN